jgi:hypothetical protein
MNSWRQNLVALADGRPLGEHGRVGLGSAPTRTRTPSDVVIGESGPQRSDGRPGIFLAPQCA